MIPYLDIAIKSIRANLSRSIVTVLLTAFSSAILIFSSTLMDGQHGIMLKNAVEVYPGYIQITNREFRQTPSFDNLIFDKKSVIDRLKLHNDIQTIASRFGNSPQVFSSPPKTMDK